MRLNLVRRRGIASVIGTIFFVFVLMGALGALAYTSSLQAQSSQAVQQAQSVAAAKADEQLLFSTPSSGLTVTDSGPTATKVIAMVLKFENGSVYSLNSGSTPAFAPVTLPQGASIPLQSLVPSGTCKDQSGSGVAACLSKYNSIVNNLVSGRSLGLVTSLGNTFWYTPSSSWALTDTTTLNYGLAAYWPFDGGTVPNTSDLSGNGNTGTFSGSVVESWGNGVDGWSSSCPNSGGAVAVSVVTAPIYLNNPNSLDVHNSGGTTQGCAQKSMALSAGDVIGVAETGGAAGSASDPACWWTGTGCSDTSTFMGTFGSWYYWTAAVTVGGSYTLQLYNQAASTLTSPTDQYFSVLIRNMPMPVVGKFGNALSFLSNQYVSVGTPTSLGFASGSKIGAFAWIYPTTLAGEHAIFSQTAPGILFEQNGAQLKFWANVNNPSTTSTFASGLTANTWNFVGVTYDDARGAVTFYTGTTANTQSITANQMTASNSGLIGSYGGGRFFSGIIDDLRVYNRAPSGLEEATLDHSAPVPAPKLDWEQLTYPPGCPPGQFINQLGVSITCAGAGGMLTAMRTTPIASSGGSSFVTAYTISLAANTEYAIVIHNEWSENPNAGGPSGDVAVGPLAATTTFVNLCLSVPANSFVALCTTSTNSPIGTHGSAYAADIVTGGVITGANSDTLKIEICGYFGGCSGCAGVWTLEPGSNVEVSVVNS